LNNISNIYNKFNNDDYQKNIYDNILISNKIHNLNKLIENINIILNILNILNSFTMQGPSTTDENLMGVIPNSFSHIFQFVKTTKDIDFLIRCS